MRRRTLIGVIGGTMVGGCLGPIEQNAAVPETKLSTPVVSTPVGLPDQESTTTPPTDTGDAAFEVVEWSLPKTVEIKEGFWVTVTIKNTTDERRTFEAPMYFRTPESQWRDIGTWTGENLEPGQTLEMTSYRQVWWPYLGEIEFRLGASSNTASVRVVSRTPRFGQTYTAPNDVTVTVAGISLESTYSYKALTGETKRKDAPKGKQWAFVQVRAKNSGDGENPLPLRFDFKIVSSGKKFEHVYTVKDDGEYTGGDVSPGVVREGWILYELPAAKSVADLAVKWHEFFPKGDIGVVWSGSGEP